MTTPDKKSKSDLEASYRALLEGNRRFVEETTAADPDYFKRLAAGQHPQTLWIGCADSRVPANQITGTAPGDIFVHRNIANVVVHTDTNMLSVLQYAVEVLEVPQIIVCGHYGCGGVAAALGNKSFGLINTWLRNIKDVHRFHAEELSKLESQDAVLRRLVELNVQAGVRNLCRTSIVQRAWKKRGGPQIHGWVYDLSDGLIKDLKVDASLESLEPIDRYDFEDEPAADA